MQAVSHTYRAACLECRRQPRGSHKLALTVGAHLVIPNSEQKRDVRGGGEINGIRLDANLFTLENKSECAACKITGTHRLWFGVKEIGQSSWLRCTH